MGNTGNSTGTHLHLECSTTEAWQCGTFLNPGEILGFGNVRGTIIEYSGTPSSSWISRDSALNENEMKHNADILISYYRSQGINDKTIAGILANMQAESTINPGRQEVGGSGYGIVQWTPVSVLQNHCSTLGLSPYTDGDVQIRVLLSEIRNEPNVEEWYSSQSFIENYYNSGATSDMIGITGSQFLSNSMNWDADKLAIMFMVAYERPSYDPNINHYQLRKMLALIWYTYISGITTNNNYKKWLMCRSKNIRIKYRKEV